MEFSLLYKNGSTLVLEPSEDEKRTAHIYGDGLVSINSSVFFIEACLPEWPVYVRWINHLGGFEYYMFNGNKEYAEDVSRGEEYVLAGGGALDATASRGVLPGLVSRTISCGAEGLDFDMWKFLKGLALSPQVWLYDTTRAEFVEVTLGNTQIRWNSGNTTGSVDFELKLINEDWMI